jgi:membrane-bound inhibitor of C-type lysozyme
MAGLDPAIYVFMPLQKKKTWMPGTRPGMNPNVYRALRLLSVILAETGRATMKRRKAIIFGVALSVMPVATNISAAAQARFQSYACADGSQFIAAFYPSDPKRAHLQIDGRAVTLAKRLALSGTRYTGGGVTLRITKAVTTIKHGKRPASVCSMQ